MAAYNIIIWRTNYEKIISYEIVYNTTDIDIHFFI